MGWHLVNFLSECAAHQFIVKAQSLHESLYASMYFCICIMEIHCCFYTRLASLRHLFLWSCEPYVVLPYSAHFHQHNRPSVPLLQVQQAYQNYEHRITTVFEFMYGRWLETRPTSKSGSPEVSFFLGSVSLLSGSCLVCLLFCMCCKWQELAVKIPAFSPCFCGACSTSG